MVTKKLAKKEILKADFLNEDKDKENFLKTKIVKDSISPQDKAAYPLECFAKYNQLSPVIMLIHTAPAKCNVCKSVNDTYVPEIEWFYKNKHTNKMKTFKYKFVCQKCLVKTGVKFLTNAMISKVLALSKGKVHAIFDYTELAICNVCMKEDECKKVRIRVQGLLMDIHLCKTHAKKIKVAKNMENAEAKILKESIDEIDATEDQEETEFEELDWVKDIKALNEGYSYKGDELNGY